MAASDLEPKLLLFLSVDVYDSTALKARAQQAKRTQTWLPSFRTFYRRFPEYLARECAKNGVQPPNLWKCLGDELIFFVKLTRADDALNHVRSLRGAAIAYNSLPAEKGYPIQVKCAAWLAGFPVGNAEIEVADFAEKTPNRLDFIGPQMDLGFRLARLASLRRFVVSVDLVLLLLDEIHELKLYFDGLEVLKGALNNAPYPITWIDMLDRPRSGVEELRGSPPDPYVLKTFCKDFIKSTDGALMMPFIDGDARFSERPLDWESRLADTRALLREEDEDVSVEGMEPQLEGAQSASDSSPSALLNEATEQFENLGPI